MSDSLDHLFEGDTGPTRTYEPARPVPVYKSAVERFEEGCPKCKGSGRFISYAGRDIGECFACKGAGKRSYKTSAETRANARDKSAERKVRNEEEMLADFAKANKAEHAWLITTAPRWEVARSLLAGVMKYGSLTEKQMALVQRGIERDAQRAAKPADAPSLDVAAIEAAFATARERAARPGQMGVFVKPLILAAGPSKTDIAFKASAGDGRWAGMVFFKSMDDRKLGYVKDGRFNRQFACTDAEQDAVLKVASNPKEGLFAYAKAWSKCGVCGRGLLNDVSIERGIGPICMEKYGFA